MIFLTCDAFGVLPPVSSLSPAQAMYHFISGYTAKVAGTEMGVKEPSGDVLAVFRRPVPGLAPEQVRRVAGGEDAAAQGARVAGEHRLERRRLRGGQADQAGPHTRHHRRHPRRRAGRGEDRRDPVFGFDVVTECPGVPGEILLPRETWADKAAYDATARKLAGFSEELCDVRRRCRRGGEGRRAERVTRIDRRSGVVREPATGSTPVRGHPHRPWEGEAPAEHT